MFDLNQYPDRFLDLHACDLLHRHGFTDGTTPGPIGDWYCAGSMSPLARRNAMVREIGGLWRTQYLPDLVRWLLLPLIPVPVEIDVVQGPGGNTVRAVRVADFLDDTPTWNQNAAEDLLRPYHVRVPWQPIIDYVTYRDDYLLTGRSTELLLMGLSAGMPEPQVRADLTSGALTSDRLPGLRMLAGLYGTGDA